MVEKEIGTEWLGNYRCLFVRQQVEVSEIIIDWEVANRYEILDEHEQRIGAVLEKGSGVGNFLRRGILKSHRGFNIAVVGASGELALWLRRRFFFFFSNLEIYNTAGRLFGCVRRRFGILYKKYDLVDGRGQVFARIKSPLWRLWTFPVRGIRAGREAQISKRWGGVLREVFTDADTYRIDFGHGDWSGEEKAIIFAAAISIDFDFFEHNQSSNRVL